MRTVILFKTYCPGPNARHRPLKYTCTELLIRFFSYQYCKRILIDEKMHFGLVAFIVNMCLLLLCWQVTLAVTHHQAVMMIPWAMMGLPHQGAE